MTHTNTHTDTEAIYSEGRGTGRAFRELTAYSLRRQSGLDMIRLDVRTVTVTVTETVTMMVTVTAETKDKQNIA